jgi:hypothetical protein
MLRQSDPEAAEALLRAAERDIRERWAIYRQLATARPT